MLEDSEERRAEGAPNRARATDKVLLRVKRGRGERHKTDQEHFA